MKCGQNRFTPRATGAQAFLRGGIPQIAFHRIEALAKIEARAGHTGTLTLPRRQRFQSLIKFSARVGETPDQRHVLHLMIAGVPVHLQVACKAGQKGLRMTTLPRFLYSNNTMGPAASRPVRYNHM